MTGVVHRDLKLENILVDDRAAESELIQTKLIDFGTSKIFHRADDYWEFTHRKKPLASTFSEKVGTVTYMPLDILKKTDGVVTRYTESCDMWSLGCIAYALLTGTLPWTVTHPKDMTAK